MAEALGFEDKIQRLIEYHESLRQLDPKTAEPGLVGDLRIFYWGDGIGISQSLGDAQESVLQNITGHAKKEYYDRNFAARDLRKETDARRHERADVLSVMTAPLTQELRQERAKRITGVLGLIVEGGPIRMTEYDYNRKPNELTEVTIDTTRPLFGVFRNGHASNRTLNVQYDNSITHAANSDEHVGELVLSVEIPDLFASKPISLEAAA